MCVISTQSISSLGSLISNFHYAGFCQLLTGERIEGLYYDEYEDLYNEVIKTKLSFETSAERAYGEVRPNPGDIRINRTLGKLCYTLLKTSNINAKDFFPRHVRIRVERICK